MILELLFVFTAFTYVLSQPCPISSEIYPAPYQLNSDIVLAAKDNLTATLTSLLQNNLISTNFSAFSVDVYSTRSNGSIFTYHHSGTNLSSEGVQKVDSDSIFRIGSISKLLTVYTYLISVGDFSFNDPITNYVPELATTGDDPITNVQWDSITIGALASQMANIGRDVTPSPEADRIYEAAGLPPVPHSNASFCGSRVEVLLPCDRKAFFEDIIARPPVFAPFTTPVYSNLAYQILQYALENITNTYFPDLFNTSLLLPLNLTHTSYALPVTNSSSVIPWNASMSLYDADLYAISGAGNYYSSTNDLRSVGKSILRSSILSSAQTRRWMKPVAFVPGGKQAVGAPWEIVKAPNSHPVWIYTKGGALGYYHSMIGLIPDYDVGFTILTAGVSTATTPELLADTITEIMVPALAEQAMHEAVTNYAGTYTDSTTNSFIVIENSQTASGLAITRFTYRGSGTLLTTLLGASGSDLPDPISIPLFPTGLVANNRTSWRAVFSAAFSAGVPTPNKAFAATCKTWFMVDSPNYGGVGLDDVVFTLDASGKAVTLDLRGFRLSLTRFVDDACASSAAQMPFVLRSGHKACR